MIIEIYARMIFPKPRFLKLFFSMKKGKAPGTDGFSVEFYCAFWQLIKNALFGQINNVIKLV